MSKVTINWSTDEYKPFHGRMTPNLKSSVTIFIRRRSKEHLNEACLVATVKHGGGTVLVWRYFAGRKRKRERKNTYISYNISHCHQKAALLFNHLHSRKIMRPYIVSRDCLNERKEAEVR